MGDRDHRHAPAKGAAWRCLPIGPPTASDEGALSSRPLFCRFSRAFPLPCLRQGAAMAEDKPKSKSLLEQLPEIVRAGKRQAERILEGLEGKTRVGLQTRELVTPAKDSNWQMFQALRTMQKAKATLGGNMSLVNEGRGQTELTPTLARQWFNRLIYGDNLLAMAALLAGDDGTPSLRGKIDLFYIDPPFDSKADYRTKITLPGGDVEQKPTVIEQFAYSDTWADGTASYLAMIVPRLCLMRELLSAQGSIYVHLDWHVGKYRKRISINERPLDDDQIRSVHWMPDKFFGRGRDSKLDECGH